MGSKVMESRNYESVRTLMEVFQTSFLKHVLFTNSIVTAIETCVAIPMVLGFNGDHIAFVKELPTLAPMDCLIKYMLCECKLLERMVFCSCFITTYNTQITINSCMTPTKSFSCREQSFIMMFLHGKY